MKQGNFFPYDWNLVNSDDEDLDHTLIRVYGLNENNETISIIIRDFQPWVYVELPNYFKEQHARGLKNAILEKMKINQHPTSITLCLKKKLYGADFDSKGDRKLFPFLKVTFKTPAHIRVLGRMIRFNRHWPGLGILQLKMHEDNAHPVLQLCCEQNVPVCGWIAFEGIQKKKRKETRCELEYEVSYKKLKTNAEIHTVPNPVIMAYDLEVYSSVRGSMPKHFRPKDEIFQISVVVGRQGSGEYESFLLTLGEPDPGKTGDEVEIRMFDTEADLIVGFTECVQEFQPNVITGYNIFEFDIDYMIKRSKYRSCFYDFARQGLNMHGLDVEKSIEWGSSAFQNQKFLYLHAEGRLFVDLLPVVRRDYKFSTYKLKEISTAFLGETKDPLTPDGIFQNYRVGMKWAGSGDPSLRAKSARALAVIGKYCVVDSVLVYKLFEKIQTWVGLTEMARICNTQIFFLFTQGQQIKVFSQVYKRCIEENYVVERDGFQAGENESYTGAHVFEPMAGVWDWVVPLDFTSLYPTIVIAYNICWSTWVRNGSDILDEDCHVFEWHDHFGCEHDTVKRASKKIICEPRYYRFLKKPKGVLPSLLENLLGARNSVKGQIKETGKEKDKFPEKAEEYETKLVVLDKRQLALKISANSMYGILGVRKGYLPFMPGAMCVTAKGRESIIKVSKLATEKFGLIRIYGDSVTGDTPLLLKDGEGRISIRTIESLSEEWTAYDGFKAGQSNRREKQQAQCDLEIWAVDKQTKKGRWSKIKRVIRHKTAKKLYRVSTRAGCIDVTEDHSLLDANCEKVRPGESKIGDELLHSFPEEFPERTTLRKDVEEKEMIGRGSCKELYKVIPDVVLNSPKEIRRAFLEGYYAGGGSKTSQRGWGKDLQFCCKGKIGAQRLYYLLKSLGYDANIRVNEDKLDIYLLTTSKKFRKNPNHIKRIIDLGETKGEEFVYDIETENGTFLGGVGSMIVSNTDSNYLQFPGLTDPRVIWDRAIEVAAEISKEFPSPMKLLFEMTIYKRFMILTKKRYMSIECDRDGNEKDGISKKGVMLARRDNSKAVRDIYAATVMDVFNKVPEKEVIENMVERIMRMCRGELPYKDFIITKRVGEVSDYKIRELPEDEKKRQARLESLGCEGEEDYKIKALPAQAQLLLKMQSRGENVGAGTRLEYVVTTTGGHKARQFAKIEDANYFMRHTSVLKIDFLYYVHNLSTQMDQVLEVVYGRKKFVKELYKELLQTFALKEKLVSHLEEYFFDIEFKEEKSNKKTAKSKKKAVIIIEDE